MKLLSVIFIGFTILLLAAFPATAQQKDFQVWPSLEISAEIHPKLKLHLEEEVRFRENSSLFSRQINDLGASYRFNKYLRAGIFYRIEADWRNAVEYSWRKGLYSDISLRYDVNRFTLGYRIRLQSAKVERASEQSMFDGFRHRHKFSVAYDIKGIPLSPFCESELFADAGQQKGLKGIRTWLGLDYTINKAHTIGLKYGFDRELNTLDPLTAWIIAFGYSFNFTLVSAD